MGLIKEQNICNFAIKSEFTKLSGEQSQTCLSYAMTMSKSRKPEFMCKPNAELNLFKLC